MKKKMLFLGVLAVVLLSGCTTNANVTINNDLTSTESVKITFPNDSVDSSNTDPQCYANNYINYYRNAINLKNYSYNFENGSVSSTEVFTKTSKDVCTAINNNMFSQFLYKTFTCEETDDYYVIASSGVQLVNAPDSEKTFNTETVNLTFTLPKNVKAEENDADSVDGNNYTWTYDKQTDVNKSFYLKISKSTLNDAK